MRDRTQTFELQHPLYQVPSVATKQGHYRENGEAIGLQLLFCDGHTACLTYEEIERLEQAIADDDARRPPAAANTAVTRSHITINRQGFDYTMTLVRAGIEVVIDHRINRERAMEIIAEHAATSDRPDFDKTQPLTWTWSVEVLNEDV